MLVEHRFPAGGEGNVGVGLVLDALEVEARAEALAVASQHQKPSSRVVAGGGAHCGQ